MHFSHFSYAVSDVSIFSEKHAKKLELTNETNVLKIPKANYSWAPEAVIFTINRKCLVKYRLPILTLIGQVQ